MKSSLLDLINTITFTVTIFIRFIFHITHLTIKGTAAAVFAVEMRSVCLKLKHATACFDMCVYRLLLMKGSRVCGLRKAQCGRGHRSSNLGFEQVICLANEPFQNSGSRCLDPTKNALQFSSTRWLQEQRWRRRVRSCCAIRGTGGGG